MSTGKNKSTPKEVMRMKNSLKLAKTIKTSELDSKQCGKRSKTLHKEKDTKANKNVNQATAPLTSLTKSKQDLHDSKLSLASKTLPPTRPEDFSSNWKKMQSILQPKGKRTGPPPRKKRKLEISQKRDSTGIKQNGTEVPSDEIWFDDVDDILIEKRPVTPAVSQNSDKAQNHNPLVFPNGLTEATKALAMDCEMVGVGRNGEESVLARVSLVNQHGNCIYDKFVKAREKVTDYRTHVSGVRPDNLEDGEDFHTVQKEVSDLLEGHILVGHAIHNDLKVLFLDHPRRDIRDTSRYKPFRQLMGGRTPSLKKLTSALLGVAVQEGEHNSILLWGI
ncbi:hypothetical protein C0Q70_15538 [Pomacea canaliculata]|uniref:RNA exonuclease 4 n=1 Tax=Pomacea canaliculata TaxID=400727 RepID=A0A2T7NV48_POMCA|nr:hypothetical protein C0Q70_15538 [Pomacea canaliculata]